LERITSAALAGEGREHHEALDIFREVARQRRFAGSSVAEQAKQLRTVLRRQPSRHGLERLILRLCP